jgi:hypothetical protein
MGATARDIRDDELQKSNARLKDVMTEQDFSEESVGYLSYSALLGTRYAFTAGWTRVEPALRWVESRTTSRRHSTPCQITLLTTLAQRSVRRWMRE